MNSFREVAIEAARTAGDYTLQFLDKPIAYTMKNDHDIQAEADLACEKIIISLIKDNFPSHSILAEESGQDEKISEYLWVIDPIDGTINFSRHIEEYCVSIALVHNGKIILGVIYQPVQSKLVVAEAGQGTYVNDQKVSVSQESQLINTLVATDNSSHINARKLNIDTLSRFSSQVRHTRIFGSAAMGMARVAQGQIDIYYKQPFNYWDYAAGVIIVEEAGGIVTDMHGNPIMIDSQSIVASNGLLQAHALAVIKA